MNGKLAETAYESVGSEFDSAETAADPSEFNPNNTNGFPHHEPALSSARTSSSQSKCRNVSIAMPRGIKIDDLRLVAKKGPQVEEKL